MENELVIQERAAQVQQLREKDDRLRQREAEFSEQLRLNEAQAAQLRQNAELLQLQNADISKLQSEVQRLQVGRCQVISYMHLIIQYCAGIIKTVGIRRKAFSDGTVYHPYMYSVVLKAMHVAKWLCLLYEKIGVPEQALGWALGLKFSCRPAVCTILKLSL